jgi:hypothetical protein
MYNVSLNQPRRRGSRLRQEKGNDVETRIDAEADVTTVTHIYRHALKGYGSIMDPPMAEGALETKCWRIATLCLGRPNGAYPNGSQHKFSIVDMTGVALSLGIDVMRRNKRRGRSHLSTILKPANTQP